MLKVASPKTVDLTIIQGSTFDDNRLWVTHDQLITVTPTVGAVGYFKLTARGVLSQQIVLPVTNTKVYEALANILAIGANGVTLTGSGTGPYTATWANDLALTVQPKMTSTVVFDTGGTVTIAYVPIDLTGCSAKMQVRATADSATVLLELLSTGGSPRIVLGGTAGTIQLLVTDEDTALLVPASWPRDSSNKPVYELKVTFSDGHIETWMQGKVDLVPGVVR